MRVLVVEDEAVVARRIVRLTQKNFAKELESIRVVADLTDARELVSKHPIDLVFLDLNLNGENGFELLKDAAAGAYHTIVVSAYTDKAIDAFEYGVLDFIAKPFGEDRFVASLKRFTQGRGLADHNTRQLAIAKIGCIELVSLEDIAWIKAAGPYSDVVLLDGRIELHHKSLDRLNQILPATFKRIHRSYVANMAHAIRIHVKGGSQYELEVLNRKRLPIGRSRYKELRQWMEEGQAMQPTRGSASVAN